MQSCWTRRSVQRDLSVWWWLQCWKCIAFLYTQHCVLQECTVWEYFLAILVLCALCTLVERSVQYREMLCAFSIAIIIINCYEFTNKESVFEHFLDTLVLCSLVECGVRYREMLCAFSIAITITMKYPCWIFQCILFCYQLQSGLVINMFLVYFWNILDFQRNKKKSCVNFPMEWIHLPIFLTWDVSLWWWLQCWKCIASLCTKRCVQQDCTVHRVPKCLWHALKFYHSQMLRFTRVHSLRTFFRHFCTLCTVHSCWTLRLVHREAMRFQHCNHHHQLVRIYSPRNCISFWTFFKYFCTLCTVQSCWTRRSVQRDAMRFQHCNHHHQLTAQVKTTGKYIHTFGKFTRLFFYFYERKKISAFDYYLKVRKCLFSISFL